MSCQYNKASEILNIYKEVVETNWWLCSILSQNHFQYLKCLIYFPITLIIKKM